MQVKNRGWLRLLYWQSSYLKLRAEHKGGNSWNSFLLNNGPNDYMLTPRGQRGKRQRFETRD